MDKANHTEDGATEALEEQLLPAVDVSGVGQESDIEAVNELAFELYKEALSVVYLTSHVFYQGAVEDDGWPRNQAICAGLLVRISKFMLVVTELSAKGDRAEVVAALNRSILETAVNLEYLVASSDDIFDKFVTESLGPERELYDTIMANIQAHGGETSPIEQRMLNSINDVCRLSGVNIEKVEKKHKDWGGNVRSRLQALGKAELYAGIIRIPSHAVHGNWVDVYKNHIEVNTESGLFRPKSSFSYVDDRYLGPVARLVLEATMPYIRRYFTETLEIHRLSARIQNLVGRIIMVGEAHERLLSTN